MPVSARLERWLDLTADLKRETSQLLQETAQGSHTGLTISRTDPFHISIILEDGTNSTGDVTVTGTDEDDAAQSKTVSFTGNQRRLVSNTQWKSITKYTTSGLTNEASVPTLTIEATSSGGTPDESITTVQKVKARITRDRQSDLMKTEGGIQESSASIIVWPDVDVRIDDRLVFTDRGSFEVKSVNIPGYTHGERPMKILTVFAVGQT